MLLNPVDYIKFLGMFIDKNLYWNHHAHNLSIQLIRANGILSKLRYTNFFCKHAVGMNLTNNMLNFFDFRVKIMLRVCLVPV